MYLVGKATGVNIRLSRILHFILECLRLNFVASQFQFPANLHFGRRQMIFKYLGLCPSLGPMD